jgi:hypothetical protein
VRLLLRAARFALVVAILTAVSYQLINAGGAKGVVNLFSFFTVLSNLIGMVVWAMMVARGGQPATARFAWWRGAALLYLATTGIVFAVLLSDVSVGLLQPWINFILHQLVPAAFILDWLIDGPRHRIARGAAAKWAMFPLGYLAYTLVRGELTTPAWYPYPFVNVTEHGYGGVLVNSVVLLVAFLAASAALWWLTNWRVERREARAA